ncbi:hypothetical protein L3Y34_005033 [Caenorhabditis briggsae]|uniref:PX domain-containing protein n=1 Tax=Caenorhabditis briggsae TaxID=6238 RepID=A0AAE9D714_CAEBR|nr:hypothetical protein L3Y34_005033 [Caenorhabditis briggsae]
MALLNIQAVSAQMDANFNAKILNFRMVEEGKYTVYRIQITVDTYTWTVERRYSDFDAYDIQRFTDRKKSFLPPKKRLGNKDLEFIEERRIELEKYVRALLELEVWYQKQKNVHSLPLISAKFFDFHQYEIHSIVDDLSLRLGNLGDGWLESSQTSPKYFEFTPIEVHAITERLRLPEPTAPDVNMVADIGNTIDFLHRVRALKIRGQKGYVGTSNIVWNSLDMSLYFCKSLKALWIADSDVCRINGIKSIRETLRRLVVHYSMKKIKDLLFDEEDLEAALMVEEMGTWKCLEEVDLSFNEIKCFDESMKLLPEVRILNVSYNSITDIGTNLAFLSSLTELDLSNNTITKIDAWNEKLGNVKKLILSENAIEDLTGLGKLYSLEYLDVKGNNIQTLEAVQGIGKLPCLEILLLRDNPIRKLVEYRTKVLELFGERSSELKLDGRRPEHRELDTVRVRMALRKAKEEKEERERRRKERIEERIRYISGEDVSPNVSGSF